MPRSSESYQSEAALEQAFIKMLGEQSYDYVAIRNSDELEKNLRKQLEILNNYSFSDSEWKSFFSYQIANPSEGIVEKTKKIQVDHVQVPKKDDGSSQNT